METKFRAVVEMTEKQFEALKMLGIECELIERETNVGDKVDPAFLTPAASDSAQEQVIEPENIDKVGVPIRHDPFVRAQISTKNQMILRNILAIISSIGVILTFILEKLGVI